MMVFRVAVMILIAICIIGEIVICVWLNDIWDAVSDMKGIYKDLIQRELETTGDCLNKWRGTIDNWERTIDKWDDTVKMFLGFMGDINDEPDNT